MPDADLIPDALPAFFDPEKAAPLQPGGSVLTDAAPYPGAGTTQNFWGDSLLYAPMPAQGVGNAISDKWYQHPNIKLPGAETPDSTMVHTPPWNDFVSPTGEDMTMPEWQRPWEQNAKGMAQGISWEHFPEVDVPAFKNPARPDDPTSQEVSTGVMPEMPETMPLPQKNTQGFWNESLLHSAMPLPSGDAKIHYDYPWGNETSTQDQNVIEPTPMPEEDQDKEQDNRNFLRPDLHKVFDPVPTTYTFNDWDDFPLA